MTEAAEMCDRLQEESIERRQRIIKWVKVGCIVTLLLLTPSLVLVGYQWLPGGGENTGTDVCQGIATGENSWAQPCHASDNSSVCCLDFSKLRCLAKITGADFIDRLCAPRERCGDFQPQRQLFEKDDHPQKIKSLFEFIYHVCAYPAEKITQQYESDIRSEVINALSPKDPS